MTYGTAKHERDIYGWYHLFKSALIIERALGNKDEARQTAHGFWRCAVLSGSIASEAHAAHAMCLMDPNQDEPEVMAAVDRLHSIGDLNQSRLRRELRLFNRSSCANGR